MSRVEAQLRPRWAFRLPGASPDGVLRRRGDALERLIHVDGEPVTVVVSQPSPDLVRLSAEGRSPGGCDEAIDRMRFALSLDDDLAGFYRRFRDDPLIGSSVRARPWLRLHRRPRPFEALAWAVTEQLIEYRRAVGIQRRIIASLGRRDGKSGLAEPPDAEAVAAAAPAQLEAAGLSTSRSVSLRHAARMAALGRVDLESAGQAETCARLRTVPGIGRWTVDIFAVGGQGRYDAIPAGDLGFLKWCGRALHRRPGALATEEEVRELFAPYGEWAALAGAHALRVSSPGAERLRRAGTRWSSPRAAPSRA